MWRSRPLPLASTCGSCASTASSSTARHWTTVGGAIGGRTWNLRWPTPARWCTRPPCTSHDPVRARGGNPRRHPPGRLHARRHRHHRPDSRVRRAAVARSRPTAHHARCACLSHRHRTPCASRPSHPPRTVRPTGHMVSRRTISRPDGHLPSGLPHPRPGEGQAARAPHAITARRQPETTVRRRAAS